jgi:sulfotransferase
MTSPVAELVGEVQPKMSGGEFATFFDNPTRADIVRGLFESYYRRKISSLAVDPVVFDTNRTWTQRAALISQLYPASRIICCVREIGWIIDSVERMLAGNPLQHSRIFKFQPGSSIYERVESMMNSDKGLIGLPWSGLREAWFGENARRLILIPYATLVNEPEKTMRRLYAELGEIPFNHDFQNVSYDEVEYDANIGMPGLHTVRPKVEHKQRQPCIPPDIFMKYAATHFWENQELNTRGVTIL